MPRSRKAIPSYRRHARSGQAVVTITLPDGRRRDVYLGRYESLKSKQEYRRIIAELCVGPAATIQNAAPQERHLNLCIAELLAAFWDHAEAHYCNADGSPGRELADYSLSLRELRDLYDHTPACDFGPLRLKAVRQRMIDGRGDRPGLCRRVVNQRIGRIKRVFKWAASEELIPASVYEALKSVEGLRQGKTSAKDYAEIEPVSDADLERTLPKCPRPIASMLRLLRLTGCRPGELTIMRPEDIDTTADVWTYRPSSHKTAYRGRKRLVCFGPKAQLILKPYLTTCPAGEYVFSPIRERAKRHEEMRRMRKTPVQPSQVDRSIADPKKMPLEKYDVRRLSKAVSVACDKAKVTPWSPYQLRHAAATDVRRDFGLEAAQVVLGHSRADVTQVYAARDHGKAVAVAKAVG